jgi:SAM-dependent methyltransferase
MNLRELRHLYVKRIYGDHNFSIAVRRHLHLVLSRITSGQTGLNVGAGFTRLHPQVVNVDVVAGTAIDYQASVLALPFRDGSFDVVITQETLEHVSDPFKAMSEIARVLKRGGALYCQLPFVIGFHPGPQDFWRFTAQGIRELVERSGLRITEQMISVGGATGYYRISVEFWSGLFSLGRPPLYKVLKALFALLLYPVKWLDVLFALSPERDRIPGGYLVIAYKN